MQRLQARAPARSRSPLVSAARPYNPTALVGTCHLPTWLTQRRGGAFFIALDERARAAGAVIAFLIEATSRDNFRIARIKSSFETSTPARDGDGPGGGAG